MTEIPKKEDIHMTVSFVIFTIVYGTVSSILGTYIVRILDRNAKTTAIAQIAIVNALNI